MLGRGKEELSVMEAVDNLSNMAEIDLKTPLDLEAEEEEGREVNWRDPRQALMNESGLRETFRVIHRYLQNMIRNDQNVLKDPQVQKGIHAIMLLATEAATKMDRFAGLYPKHFKPVSELKEYTDLRKYYRQQILKQMPQPKESPEDWEEEVGETIEGERQGLRDLESVRTDQNYELFFIKDENKKPYFSRSLLRHIRIVGNFDELVTKAEGGDPILHIRELLDWEVHEGAKEALSLSMPYIDDFYKEAMQHKDRPYIGSLNKAIMALRMASNPKNLIENQSFKSCLEYYGDFHRFLRDAMKAPGYIQRISEGADDYFSQALLRLTHALCCFFFMRIEPKKEALKLIHKMEKRGAEMLGQRPQVVAEIKELQLYSDLLHQDENIRFLLRHYPNGPIFRTLDAFREREEYEGFDPLMHFNFPSQLFNMLSGEHHITVMRLPCPVHQESINHAEVVEEFAGFIRYYSHELKPDKHLMINLQDRTSWQEFTRCRVLEDFSQKADIHESVFVLGLPKNGDFYTQMGEYESINGAPIFIEQFKAQVKSRGECGYFWPYEMKVQQIDDFLDEACQVIHHQFFGKKTTLTLTERQAFIEIFYLLFTIKIAEELEVDSLSFTCKDGLDTSAAMNGMLFGFIKLLSSEKKWTQKEIDDLLWMVYSPALLVRDRAVMAPRFKRCILLLEEVHKACLENHNGIVKGVNSLYKSLKFPIEMQFPTSSADEND